MTIFKNSEANELKSQFEFELLVKGYNIIFTDQNVVFTSIALVFIYM